MAVKLKLKRTLKYDPVEGTILVHEVLVALRVHAGLEMVNTLLTAMSNNEYDVDVFIFIVMTPPVLTVYDVDSTLII